MFKYLLMLSFYITAQRTDGITLFDYNVNPQYDLIAESTSYPHFWQSPEFFLLPVDHYKHLTKRGHSGIGNGKRGHGLPIHAFHDHHHVYSSEEFNGRDELYDFSQRPKSHYPHVLPPGQAKKHGVSHGHPHEPPRRFPPPPVYDKDFINPWALPVTTPFPFIVQRPPLPTPSIYVAPKLTTRSTTTTTTTPLPPTSTASDDHLVYDIDVRFGRD